MYLSYLFVCFPQVVVFWWKTTKIQGASLRRKHQIQSNNFDGSHSVPGTLFLGNWIVGFRGFKLMEIHVATAVFRGSMEIIIATCRQAGVDSAMCSWWGRKDHNGERWGMLEFLGWVWLVNVLIGCVGMNELLFYMV